jgi:HAD superfamily hydrolase (TIGR01509 family)
MSAFKAILWDNDGILVDTEHLYCKATRQVLGKVGVELSDCEYRELFLTQNNGAWHLAAARGHSEDELELLRAERGELYCELLRGRNHAIAGVEDVLQTLHGDYTMGVVTSSHRDHFEIIHSSTGLLRYFDFVLTREQYANSKPDPEPYLAAIAKTGLSVDQCIAVEDSPRGLVAATRAGLKCVVIPTGLTVGGDFTGAYKVLGNIRELPAVLDRATLS